MCIRDRDKEKNNKLSLAHKSLYAEKAIIDPSIMADKPLGLTISTGLDALSHSMESIWNINANPISASHAIQASKLVLENLPLVAKDLKNVDSGKKLEKDNIYNKFLLFWTSLF